MSTLLTINIDHRYINGSESSSIKIIINKRKMEKKRPNRSGK